MRPMYERNGLYIGCFKFHRVMDRICGSETIYLPHSLQDDELSNFFREVPISSFVAVKYKLGDSVMVYLSGLL